MHPTTADRSMTRTIRQTTRSDSTLPAGREIEPDFGVSGEERIGAILRLPTESTRTPAVLLLHGVGARPHTLHGTPLAPEGGAAPAAEPLHRAHHTTTSDRP